jgi:hypothetical protein
MTHARTLKNDSTTNDPKGMKSLLQTHYREYSIQERIDITMKFVDRSIRNDGVTGSNPVCGTSDLAHF